MAVCGPSGSENEPLCAFIISEGKRAETCWLLRGFDPYSESVAERLNREMIKTIADAKRMELGEYMNERRGVFSEGVGRHFDFEFVYWKSIGAANCDFDENVPFRGFYRSFIFSL